MRNYKTIDQNGQGTTKVLNFAARVATKTEKENNKCFYGWILGHETKIFEVVSAYDSPK
jgi:hypothetical protein